jgi:iron complex outermembrane receptor protein
MLKSKAVWLGFCSLYFSIALNAQDCHLALRGHVTELGSSEPLAYASVFIQETRLSTETDENGYFAIPNLCEKTDYTVIIRHLECAHFTQVVQLRENTQMDFHLTHNAILNEVVIKEKAIAPPSTQADNLVERADLEATKGLNFSETLRKIPGVSLLSSGGTIAKPVIQGLHSNRIAIVTDGVTLQSQQWGSDHAPEIDPFAADKITVVKGAAGVKYGVGAMAGAIVLEPAPLRKESGINGWASLGGFSNGLGGVASGSLDWRPRRGGMTFRLQGTAKRSGNLRAPNYWLGNTAAREFNFSAIADWDRNRWHHTLSTSQFGQEFSILRAAHTGSVSDLLLAIESETPRNNLDYFTYKLDRPKQRVQHNVLKYKGVFQLNELWKLSTQYSFQNNQRREYDRGRANTIAPNKAQISFQLWSNTLDVALEHLPIRHWQGGIGIQASQQLNHVSRGGFIPDYLGLGGSVWAMERWRRYPNPWEFEIGARYDYRWNHITTTGNGINNLDKKLAFGNISGTTGAIYHFSSQLTGKLNTGYAWRPPHVNELFARGVHHGAGTYEQGNPDLNAEKAWNTNFSLSWESRAIHATVSMYHNRVANFIYLNQPRDSIVLTIRGPFPAYFYQQDDAILQGMDASLSLELLPHLSAESRISILRGYRIASQNIPNENEKFHDWLPLMPADRYQYGLKWTFGKKTSLSKISADKQNRAGSLGETFVRVLASTALRQTHIPLEGLTKAAPPTFTTIGVDAAHTFHLKGHQKSSDQHNKQLLEVGLSIQNLCNVRYREYLDLFRYFTDAPGINVGLRAKLTFGS